MNSNYIKTIQNRQQMRHSKSGIASFVLAVTLLVTVIALIIAFTGMIVNMSSHWDGTTPTQAQLQQSAKTYMSDHALYGFVYSLFFLLTIVMSVLGLIFGIFGLTRQDVKKSYAFWGTSIHAIAVIVILLFIVLGFSV